MNVPELLAPAGNFEKLRFVFAYGADAAYVSGKDFGLRAFGGNFTNDELASAVKFAHDLHRRLYVTVNIYPRSDDLPALTEHLRFLAEIGVDAALVSDLGVFMAAQKAAPNLPLHISTQANATNYAAVNAWQALGAERVVLARELTKKEIRAIRERTTVQLEMFVHGAMCMAYSGRCLLSAYLTGDDANLGKCRQPCRWKYNLVEEKRLNEFFPIAEDHHGAYIFNSKDLSLLPCLKDVIDSGIDSLKIEGRMKSVHYAATVVKVYRQAIDAYARDGESFAVKKAWLDELDKVSHRRYWTGFFAQEDDENDIGQIYGDSSYIRSTDFLGIVRECDESGMAMVEQRGKFSTGDDIEVLLPRGENFTQKIDGMTDENGQPIISAPHARQIVRIRLTKSVPPLSILRAAMADV